MSFLDQLSAKVNQGFNQVTSQTKDFTEQVKIENEIKNLEKAAQANYEELGRAMYNASRHSSGEAASVGDVSSADGVTAGAAFSGEDVSTGTASSGAAADYEVIMRQIDGILQQIQEKKVAKQEIMNRVTCPSCGKSVPAGTKFCSYCGAPMEQTPVAAAVPAEPQVHGGERQMDGEQMCGAEQPMGDDKPQMGGERHCPNCGEVIEPGAKICVKCGTRIDAGEQKPAETGDSGSSETGDSGASEIGDSCSAGAGDSAEKEEGSARIGGSAGAETEEISN